MVLTFFAPGPKWHKISVCGLKSTFWSHGRHTFPVTPMGSGSNVLFIFGDLLKDYLILNFVKGLFFISN